MARRFSIWLAAVLLPLGLAVADGAPNMAPREVRMPLVGAGAGRPAPADRDAAASHFLAQARAFYDDVVAAADFRRLGAFDQVYPGIDVAYFGDAHHLEAVFLLHPGADPALIRLQLEDMRIDAVTGEGHVVFEGEDFEAYLHAPVIYREGDAGIERLDGRYAVAFDDSVALSAQMLTPEERDRYNGSEFNRVPGEPGDFDPAYDFYMSKHEITHEQYLRFLNNAELHPDSARGTNMFFDAQGNIWINPAMEAGRDALFQIRYSHLSYDPERPPGDRYRHRRDADDMEAWRYHPVAGVTWFGAVKYANWLTLHAGRGLDHRCYREGTNTVDWAPVTATNWHNGYFYAHERDAWLAYEGFRLPMFKTYDPDAERGLPGTGRYAVTNAFNEFLKAATWTGTTNVLFGFGRNTSGALDANSMPTVLQHYGSTLAVGFFDGRNAIGRQTTRREENHYGLFDLSGNVAEWLNDPGRAGAPESRVLVGGSYADTPVPVDRYVLARPGRAADSGGFRLATTHYPVRPVRVHLLICFHRRGGIREQDVALFGPAWEEPPVPDVTPEPVEPEPDVLPEEPEIPEPVPLETPADPDVPGIIHDRPEVEPEPEPDPAPVPPVPPVPPIPPIPPEPPEPPPPPTPVRLRLGSQNPDSGVVIAVGVPDSLGQADGVTLFDRFYPVNTTVSVSAPVMAQGHVFQMWLRNGAPFSTQLTLTVQLINDLELTAVYLTPQPPPERTLTVASENPDGGVAIDVSEIDNLGLEDGITEFARVYFDGTRVVLVAPGSEAGNDFLYWFRNGVPVSTDPSLTLDLWSNTRVTAVFGPQPPAEHRYLTVESVNPNAGVTIAVDVPDTLGRGDGDTTFTREYVYGELVTLTAPVTAEGNTFVRWLRNGIEFSTDPSVQIPLIAHTLMTAVYESPPADVELRVRSANPSSGVAITVTEPDINGETDGETAFLRMYSPGTTTTLTAPTTAPNGNTFRRWLLNGAPVTTNTVLNVELHADSEATAVYAAPPEPTPERILTVLSSNPDSGVAMTVSVTDLDGETDGETAFTRRYTDGTSVTVTAPAILPDGREFDRWLLDGQPFSTSTGVSLIMNADRTLEAVYVDPEPPLRHVLAVRSQSPDSGVAVTVDPPDVNGQASAVTPFDRLYNDGESVTLTARDPALPGSPNTFKHWLMNGTPYSTDVTVTIVMVDDVEMTAVYGAPPPFEDYVTLTVQSENPASGVPIAVSLVDTNGLANGETEFVRTYTNGVTVTLDAPTLSPEGGPFLRWERNGATFTTGTSATVQMLDDTVMRAVYGPPPITHTLTVESLAPDSGVSITVDKADVDGLQDGITTFTRDYVEGESVTLTAPPEAPNGNLFQYWEVNGAPTGTNTVVTVDMLQDMNARAVYAPPGTVRLAVRSINPTSGLPVSNTTPDLNGQTDGVTAFDRVYDPGTHTTLTAPAVNDDGAPFSYWLRDGSVYSTNTMVQLELQADTEMTAVYGEIPPEPYILAVRSSNPDSGVVIEISPNDVRNLGDGTTPFARLYDGGTVVTATAPAVAPDGEVFRQWILDGMPLTTNRTVQVLMNDHHELIAEYGTPIQPDERTLTVSSENPASNVPITIDVPDTNGNTDGLTSFTRTYTVGETVTVTAPQQSGTNNTEFVRWLLNGQPYSTNLSVTVQMHADQHLRAIYDEVDPDVVLTVQSRNPDSGVTITVSPGDIDGETGGETTFDRTYPFETTVTLTAPQNASTNEFSHWEFGDGDVYSTNAVIQITLLTDITMTAVYDPVPPPPLVKLTVTSQNPDSDVTVAVTPDVNGDASGKTTFERFYEYGESVTLTAPQTSQGMVFDRWLRNGVPFSTSREVTIDMFSDVTMTAVFKDPEPSPAGL